MKEKDDILPVLTDQMQLADYALVFDLFGSLAKTLREKEVIDKILELFVNLCAPKSIAYLRFVSNQPENIALLSPRPQDAENIKASLAEFSEDYGWSDSGNGFILMIKEGNETLGVVLIDDLAFPQFKEHYLNLSLNFLNVIVLAILNSRNYERLLEANKQAADLTTIMEAERNALANERERLDVTLGSIGDGVIATDVNADVVLLNHVAEELTGWKQEEAVGKPFLEVFNIVNEKTRQKAEDPVEKALKTGVIVGLANHTVIISKDGKEHSIDDSCAPIYDQDGKIIGAVLVFRDISNRIEAEKIAKTRYRILKMASAAKSLDEFIRSLLDEMEVLTQSKIGFYHFLKDDQETLSLQEWSTNTLKKMCTAEGKGTHYPISEAGVWVEAIHRRKPVIHNNYESLNHKKGLPEGHAPIIREMIIPIIRGDKIVAIFGVGNKVSDYNQADIETVSFISDFSWEIVERKKSEEALKQEKDKIEKYINIAAVMLVAIDADQNVIMINKKGCEILGYSKNEIIGKNWFDNFLPKKIRPQVKANFEQLIKGKTEPAEYFENPVLNGKGEERLISFHNTVMRNDKGEIIATLSSGEDITERKKIDERLSWLSSFPQLNPNPIIETDLAGNVTYINPVSKRTFSNIGSLKIKHPLLKDLETAIAKMQKQKINTFNREVEVDGKIYEQLIFYVGQNNRIRHYMREITGRKHAEEALKGSEERYRATVDTASDVIISIDTKDKIVFWNPSAEKLFGYGAKEVMGKDLTSVIVPKRYRADHRRSLTRYLATGKPSAIGKTLELHGLRKDGGEFPLELSVAAWEAGGGVFFTGIIRDITERRRVQERERAARGFSDALNSINAKITSTLDFNKIMKFVASESIKAFKSETVAIALFEDNELVIRHISGKIAQKSPELLGLRLSVEQIDVKNLVEANQPILIYDADIQKWVDPDFIKKYQARSVLAVPLRTREQTIGFLAFIHHSGKIEFNDLQIDFANRLAATTSLAIENARLYEEEHESAQLRDALNSINMALAGMMNAEEIMQVVAVEGAKALNCDASGIILMKDDQWVLSYLHGMPSTLIGMHIKGEEIPHVVQAAQTKQPVIIPDILDAGVHPQLVDKFKLGAVIIVPLVIRDKLIGVIGFNYSQPTPISKAQYDFARKLESMVSLTIDNANLFAQQQNIAETLQESLLTLPVKIRGVEFGHLYRSATEAARVGGDFYDIFELGNDNIGLVIGDISGKGLEAATLTSTVKNAIRAHAFIGDSPAEVLSKTNRMIVKTTSSHMFATVFFGIIDIKNSVLTYCIAGHPPPLLISKNSKVIMLKIGSPVLGVISEFECRNNIQELQSDDILALYTDGITEARRGVELFGEERLIKLIKGLKAPIVKKIPQIILDEVTRFGGGKLADDVALLAIKLGTDQQ